ncbi:hypothetical protein SapgrDRAFT_0372 [Saprospira grandis DSM 2844]|uniref:Uncharacterized protein n=1 Tax=Saprospira grandis DSM 2844 TaxID=694433 RepID=J1I1K2_9BACT|nr:hypothetical protein [Saprospira grandis]EJF52118.1 hypothetical protein SapgrDRAFT_0372 [Saprospira grandis DSM 2844]
MEYPSKMSLLLLSMSSLLFFSSCGEETPQKTKNKDSPAKPIVEGDTTWTDGKITELSSSKIENDTMEVALMVYHPQKESNDATISIYKESSMYSFGRKRLLKSISTSKHYSRPCCINLTS